MGLLDNNRMLVSEITGLENSNFEKLFSNDVVDMYLNKRVTSADKQLKLTYRDLYAWCDLENVYIVQGKITDEPITLPINSTSFPNLRKYSNDTYPEVVHIIACPFTFVRGDVTTYGHVNAIDPLLCRICVIFANGQIYHNYPSCNDTYDFERVPYAKGSVRIESLFDKFDESVVWDMPNRKHPVKTTTGDDATLIATGAYYYNPALPDNCYEFHPALNQANEYGNTVGFGATNSVNPISNNVNIGMRSRFWMIDRDNPTANSFTYMGGLVVDDMFTMLGTYRTNSGTNPCRMCIFGTQDGGRNWYAMYEFAGSDRVKIGQEYRGSQIVCRGIPLVQTGSVTSGIYKIKRRSIIVPTADAKEPSNIFEYDSPINVSSIVGDGSSVVFTTESAHGLSNGDTIVVEYQDNVSSDGRAFDWMVNSTTSTTSGGNGILIRVYGVTSNTFSATMYVWNPDSGLPIRHIHALNRCREGVTVSCGERYPNGWILLDSIVGTDLFDGYNVANTTQNTFVRLTSTENSVLRTLGVLTEQGEDGDVYCLFATDDALIPTNDIALPEGRTDAIENGSTGVWKIPISGIDSFKDNAELLLGASQPSYGFQKVLNTLVFIDQSSNIAISSDKGKSWTTITAPYTNKAFYIRNKGQYACHFSGPTYDGRFSIDDILFQIKK